MRKNINCTWPKQKTGTIGRPISIAMRINPFLFLRKATYTTENNAKVRK